MYVIIKNLHDGSIGVHTYDGWDVFSAETVKDKGIDLTNAQRFTEGEMKLNELPDDEHWAWYGSYRRLK